MVNLGIIMKMKQEACKIMEEPDIKKNPKKCKNEKSLINLPIGSHEEPLILIFLTLNSCFIILF